MPNKRLLLSLLRSRQALRHAPVDIDDMEKNPLAVLYVNRASALQVNLIFYLFAGSLILVIFYYIIFYSFLFLFSKLFSFEFIRTIYLSLRKQNQFGIVHSSLTNSRDASSLEKLS